MAERHVVHDLANVRGIGPKYAEMLKSIGVDSTKELRHRNPAHLKTMIEERHGEWSAYPRTSAAWGRRGQGLSGVSRCGAPAPAA